MSALQGVKDASLQDFFFLPFFKTSFAGERVCFARYDGIDVRSMKGKEMSMLYISSFLRVLTTPTREVSSI